MGEWGFTVVGRKEVGISAAGMTPGATPGTTAAPVTVMGVKKKRKDGDAVTGEANGATTLDAGLVRKKAKVEPTLVQSGPAVTTNGVQVLGAGLVRKKPKSA